MEIEIKKAKPDDFGEVHRLVLEFATYIKTPEKVLITPEQMVNDREFFNCIIATKGKEIIGFATFFFSYYSWSGKAVYMDDLYVRENARGKGIGSMLFDKVIEIGKAENCHKMKWQVSSWNSKAQDFYKSRGAIIDDVEINCDLTLS